MAGRDLVGKRHFVIPDCQVKEGVPLDHLAWAARYACDKRPDVIACMGDFYDMPSLSAWDEGKKAMEGRRYADDIAAGDKALELFERELKRHGKKSWKYEKFVTLGNHEDRITRAIEASAKLDRTLSLEDLSFKRLGWKVYPFLATAVRDGIVYSHYFPIGPNGRVVQSKAGAPSAKIQCQRMMRSCTAGHRQGFDFAICHTPLATYRGLIIGSFYQHTEDYATRQGQNVWHGCILKTDVHDGAYCIVEVDMAFLGRRFG